MKKAINILFLLGAIFAIVDALLYLGVSIFFFIAAYNEELLDMIATNITSTISSLEDSELFRMALSAYLFNFATTFLAFTVLSIIAIPIFLNGRKQFDILYIPTLGPFVKAVVFGCFTNYCGLIAGILGLVYRAKLIKEKNNQVVVEQ